MSRNLTSASCHECPGDHDHIVLEEEPRPVAELDIGAHYWSTGNYRGLIVARAKCILCHTLYLAWVDWPSQAHSWWHLRTKGGQRFCDLSFRHSFNDEPGVEDLPLFEVEQVVTFRREPIVTHVYEQYGSDDERAAWHARREAVRGRAIGDDMAMVRQGIEEGSK